ncbi:unnamed protein product, partial [Brassica rapa]
MGTVQEECRDGSSTSTPPPVYVFTANLPSSLVRSSSLPLPSTVMAPMFGSDLSMQNSAMDSPVLNTAAITPDNPGSLSLSQAVAELASAEIPGSLITPSVNLDQVTEKFVPSLGSWAKPLYFKPPATPPEPTTPQDYDPAIILNKKPKGKYPPRTLQPPVEKLPPPELKADGSLRFPWAARLSPRREIFTEQPLQHTVLMAHP